MMVDGTAESVCVTGSAALDSGALDGFRLHLSKQGRLDQAEQARWKAEYLAKVERLLRGAGLDEAETAPLREIGEDLVRQASASDQGDDEAWAQHYANACAEISYHILTGSEESEAAQRVARNLVARGVPLPSRGGDARGWKRLLIYRDRIRNNQVPESVTETYRGEMQRLKSVGG